MHWGWGEWTVVIYYGVGVVALGLELTVVKWMRRSKLPPAEIIRLADFRAR